MVAESMSSAPTSECDGMDGASHESAAQVRELSCDCASSGSATRTCGPPVPAKTQKCPSAFRTLRGAAPVAQTEQCNPRLCGASSRLVHRLQAPIG